MYKGEKLSHVQIYLYRDKMPDIGTARPQQLNINHRNMLLVLSKSCEIQLRSDFGGKC